MKEEKRTMKKEQRINKRGRFLLCSLLLALCSLLNAFAQQAVIREVSGAVEVKASGASSFVTANVGDRLAEDTVISTGFKSSALIEAGATLIAVRPLTRLTLTEIRSSMGNETLNVNLQAGRVRVDVNPPAGTRTSVDVSSPSATASVRGTGFEMDLRGIVVVEGRVDFSGKRGSPVIVDAGYDSSVLTDGRASNPQGNIIAGFRPSLPVNHDRYSAPSSGGPSGFHVPANTPNTPSRPGGPSGPIQPGGPSGPSGPNGPSTQPGTGSDGDMGGMFFDGW